MSETQAPSDGEATQAPGAQRRLEERLEAALAQRDALVAERTAVLRLYLHLVEAHTVSRPGGEFEALLMEATDHPMLAGVPAGTDLMPIFVAGTGRSGTTINARLLGNHAQLVRAPGELRFHVSPNTGLPALLAGRVTLADFVDTMRTKFFERPGVGEAPPKPVLARFMTREQLDEALAAFAMAWEQDAAQACRNLIEAPIRAYLAGTELPHGWIEHTPENLLSAARLFRSFPDIRIVHAIRDGRDVASSLLTRVAGPDELVEGIRWWGHRIRKGFRQLSALPADRVHTVRLESLVETAREETLAGLLAFAGVEEDAGVREFFDSTIAPNAANRGRWRRDMAADTAEEVSLIYRGVLEHLRRAGVDVDSLLEDVPDFPEGALEREVERQELYELRTEVGLLMEENLQLGAVVRAAELTGVDASRIDVLRELRRTLGRPARAAGIR